MFAYIRSMAQTLFKNVKMILHDWVLVGIYDDGTEKLDFGNGKTFEILDDSRLSSHKTVNQTHPGIRERRGLVLAVSDKAEESGLRAGDIVLMERMKWGRKIFMTGEKGERYPVWPIKYQDCLGTFVGDDVLSEWDKERINKMYPGWEKWKAIKI